MVLHTLYPSTWETEGMDCRDFVASQDCIMRILFLKQNITCYGYISDYFKILPVLIAFTFLRLSTKTKPKRSIITDE